MSKKTVSGISQKSLFVWFLLRGMKDLKKTHTNRCLFVSGFLELVATNNSLPFQEKHNLKGTPSDTPRHISLVSGSY